jgi:hypothetical protein
MILDSIPDKTQDKNTTSLKFKKDVIDFFKDKNLDTCLEIGTNHGWTTRILSSLFKEVHTLDFKDSNTNYAKQNNADISNIIYYTDDAYTTKVWNTMPLIDVAFIDCMHTYEHVTYDINTALSRINVDKGMYFIFDDYGHPEALGVRKAIDKAIEEGLKLECYIGQPEGYQYNESSILIHHEGVILSYGK